MTGLPADQVPALSVIMPVRDGAAHLARAVDSVLAQEYPRPFEVVLAVGPSSDGTERVADDLAARHPAIRAVPNPAGTTPAALNAAIAASTGEVVARVDSHSELAPDYLARAVELLEETGADNVGGIQRAEGTTPFQRSVAAAMTSRFGVGDAKFHYGGEAGPTDTVYLGVFRRSALERVGGFDESLLRNQDYELNWRIRDTGGVVHFDPTLSVTYRPRSTWRGLARQYHEYGWWKRVVLRRHPGSLRLRQLAPPVALLLNVAGVLGAVRWRPLGLLPAAYLGAATVAAVTSRNTTSVGERARLPFVFALMHHAWAWGFLRGSGPTPPAGPDEKEPRVHP